MYSTMKVLFYHQSYTAHHAVYKPTDQNPGHEKHSIVVDIGKNSLSEYKTLLSKSCKFISCLFSLYTPLEVLLPINIVLIKYMQSPVSILY